jgi:hypothetical protein
MATYPKLPILDTSRISVMDGIVPVRASNGSLKVRKLFSSDKAEFTVEHLLTKADWDTLKAFYDANYNLDVTFNWPGRTTTYTVRFVTAPQPDGSAWRMFRVRVQLAEV